MGFLLGIITKHYDQEPQGSKLKRRKQTIIVDKLRVSLTLYLNFSKTKTLHPWWQLCEAVLRYSRALNYMLMLSNTLTCYRFKQMVYVISAARGLSVKITKTKGVVK